LSKTQSKPTRPFYIGRTEKTNDIRSCEQQDLITDGFDPPAATTKARTELNAETQRRKDAEKDHAEKNQKAGHSSANDSLGRPFSLRLFCSASLHLCVSAFISRFQLHTSTSNTESIIESPNDRAIGSEENTDDPRDVGTAAAGTVTVNVPSVFGGSRFPTLSLT
jgi:hypothetical protein